jgi:basic membrane lipoprotein Med (substrate-binding protein (PBP1-ABC) superfamily)
VRRCDLERADEDARRAAELRLRRRATRRFWGLAASLVLLVVGAAIGANLLLAGPTTSVWLIRMGGSGDFEAYLESSLERIGRELDVATHVLIPQADPAAELRSLCADGADLVFIGGALLANEAIAAATDYPETHVALLDANELAEVPPCTEAGASLGRCLPDNVLPVASSRRPRYAGPRDRTDGLGRSRRHRRGVQRSSQWPAGGARAHREDVDVVFTAAGLSGTGALVAAEELHEPDRPLWSIGVDTDWELTHPELDDRLLTSMVKRFDFAMLDIAQGLVDGTIEVPR